MVAQLLPLQVLENQINLNCRRLLAKLMRQEVNSLLREPFAMVLALKQLVLNSELRDIILTLLILHETNKLRNVTT